MKFFQSGLGGIGGASIPIQQYQVIQTLDKSGYCWFSRPRNVIAGTEHLIGTVSDFGTGYRSGFIAIDSADDSFRGRSLSSYVRQDDHEEVAFLKRSSDNRIIAAYDEHNQTRKLRWRISTNPNDASSWGAEQTVDIATSTDRTSYSALYECSNGEIFYFYRAGLTGSQSQHGWSYRKSIDDGANFPAPDVWLTDSTIDRGYIVINHDPNNPDILHFLGTRNHPTSSTNTDPGVFHGIFNMLTETWTDSAGNIFASRPINVRTQATTIDSWTGRNDMVWIEDIAIKEDDGYPMVLYYHSPLGQAPDYAEIKHRWYSEWNGSSWSTPFDMGEISTVLLETDAYTNPPPDSRMYSGLSRFDNNNTNSIWSSKEVDGTYGKKLEIFKITRNGLNNFSYRQITFNSQYHQWRPNVLEDQSSIYEAYWLELRHYDHYTDYDNYLKIAKKI